MHAMIINRPKVACHVGWQVHGVLIVIVTEKCWWKEISIPNSRQSDNHEIHWVEQSPFRRIIRHARDVSETLRVQRTAKLEGYRAFRWNLYNVNCPSKEKDEHQNCKWKFDNTRRNCVCKLILSSWVTRIAAPKGNQRHLVSHLIQQEHSIVSSQISDSEVNVIEDLVQWWHDSEHIRSGWKV